MRMTDRMDRLLTRSLTYYFQLITGIKPMPNQEERHQHQSNKDENQEIKYKFFWSHSIKF